MISRETISRIRERTDILTIVGESVRLARRGRHFVGLCPFHKEKTPSFHVSPEHQRFYCFGCHEHGSVIDFVMKLEGVDFPEALRSLAERIGVQIESEESGEPRPARRPNEHFLEVLGVAAAYFEAQLRQHPAARVAREELARRGLQPRSPTDGIADALQAFRVGYAPVGWDHLVSHLQRHGVSLELAHRVGLVQPRKERGGYYDFFRHRLMFAITDVQGRVVGFSGRVLVDPESGELDTRTGKYVNSPESAVYRKGQIVFGLYQARQAIRQTDIAIVVEGNFDVLSLHARGIRNAVAPLGTAFTESQASLLRRYSARAVLLFDADEAGLGAVRKAREPCAQAGLDVKVGSLPRGMDPDEFVRDRGAEALEHVVRSAKSMLEFLIELELSTSFSRFDPTEQARRVREVARLLATERDDAVRAMAKRYADEVASRLNIADATSVRALELVVARAVGQSGRHARPGRARADDLRVDLSVLGSILDYPDILDDTGNRDELSVLEGDVALAVALVSKLRTEEPEHWVESFLAQVPDSIQDFAARRLACPRHEDLGQAQDEFHDNVRKLKRRGVSREHSLVVEQIGRAEAQGDADREGELLLEAVRKHRERLGI